MSDEAEGDPVLKEANQLFDQEKYEEAIALYDKLIVERKYGAEPLFMKAECLSNMNRYADAISWYDKAIEIDDEDALIWNGKGNAYYHLENYVQARVCFECARDIDPQISDYLFSIIKTAILTGDIDEAVGMARETLKSTENVRDVVLSWGFSILALFLGQKPLNAIESIDELVKYMREKETRSQIDAYSMGREVFAGVDYDLCGVEKLIHKRVSGASSKILQALLSYLKGDIDIEQLARVNAEESGAIAFDDVLMIENTVMEGPNVEEFPDFEAILDPNERVAIERIDNLVKEFARELGFQSFAYLFEEYNWNQDRGPAPFLEEISNRFFVEIVDGEVRRLSIDLDMLAAAILPDGQTDAIMTQQAYAQAGALLTFPHIEELYITARKLLDIVEAMRAASFGKGKEVTLYVNVEMIPSIQEDLLKLDNVDEITEIDEIPTDYQEQGKRVVGSMVWTAKR
ncbi:MAG: tetratricopeptide repeat protein [Candidatus Sigynarchaeota archaeon]